MFLDIISTYKCINYWIHNSKEIFNSLMINTTTLEVWKIYIKIQWCYLLPECPWASYVSSHPLASHLRTGESVAGERCFRTRWSIRARLASDLNNWKMDNVYETVMSMMLDIKNRNIRKGGLKGGKPCNSPNHCWSDSGPGYCEEKGQATPRVLWVKKRSWDPMEPSVRAEHRSISPALRASGRGGSKHFADL